MLCKFCNEEIPANQENWYFRKTVDGFIPHMHKTCALRRQQIRRGVMRPHEREDELQLSLEHKMDKTNKLNDYTRDELMVAIGLAQQLNPGILIDRTVIYGR